MTIPVSKYVCGNCIRLDKKGNCEIGGLKKETSEVACFLLHNYYEDRGFEYKSGVRMPSKTS